MVAKQWVGAAPSNPKDKVTVGYIQDLVASTNIGQDTVNALIASGFATYADLSYVNSQNLLNANQAYIDAGDATRLHLSQVNHNSGVAGLGSLSAKVDRSRLSLESTQRWPTPYSSPADYNADPVTAGATEETVYSWTVGDPGYTYKLLVNGIVEAGTNRDSYYPIALVRAGAADGPIVALGYGCAECYSGTIVTSFTSPGAFLYNIPVWAHTIDIMIIGGGGGGGSGAGNPFIWGNGGGAAPWTVVTLTVGSMELPDGITQIIGFIGAGGAGGAPNVFANPGSNGGTTSATYHSTTITSGGGAAGFGVEGTQNGQNSGTVTASGITYGNNGFGCGGNGGPGGFVIGNPGIAGGGGEAMIVAHPLGGDFNVGPINVISGSPSFQDPLTGDTPLYVNLLRVVGDNGVGAVTASTYKPSMYAIPFPA